MNGLVIYGWFANIGDAALAAYCWHRVKLKSSVAVAEHFGFAFSNRIQRPSTSIAGRAGAALGSFHTRSSQLRCWKWSNPSGNTKTDQRRHWRRDQRGLRPCPHRPTQHGVQRAGSNGRQAARPFVCHLPQGCVGIRTPGLFDSRRPRTTLHYTRCGGVRPNFGSAYPGPGCEKCGLTLQKNCRPADMQREGYLTSLR